MKLENWRESVGIGKSISENSQMLHVVRVDNFKCLYPFKILHDEDPFLRYGHIY